MTIAAHKLAAQVSPERSVVSAHRGGVQVVDDLAEEWRNLCATAADDQPFFRPEWIRAHLRAFAPEAKVLLITARIDGRLCLLLPMVEEKQMFSGLPVRRLRSPVNAHGGRFDAVRTLGPDGDAAICAAWKFLKELDGWDLLEFPYTPAGSTIERLIAKAEESGFRTAQVQERPNPYVPVPSDPEFLKQMPLSSRLRTKLRQARRELAEQGSLNLFRVDAADRSALDRFYHLEASGWKGKEGSAIACGIRTRQFYDEIAESAARFGYFSLYMLELNGQLLAAHFALTSANRCYSPKVAYHESFKQFAPGHLIVAEILRDCVMRGIQGFDITGPNDEWKMKWTSETRSVNHHFVFKGAMGNLAYAVRFRLRPTIGRQLLRKLKSA
jgi:CelD/BcsL family acetyltransferase involved in cellulose biosynthesis